MDLVGLVYKGDQMEELNKHEDCPTHRSYSGVHGSDPRKGGSRKLLQMNQGQRVKGWIISAILVRQTNTCMSFYQDFHTLY